MRRNIALIGIVASAILLALTAASTSSQAQSTPDKGYYVFNLDGYGGAVFVGMKSDINSGSVQSCGPCNTVPKILSTFAGPFGSSDAANYDLCKHVSNYHGGDDNHVSRATIYGQQNIDADNLPDCTQYTSPPPNPPVVQGPASGSGGSSGSSGSNGPTPTATPTALAAHLDCGNYLEVTAGSNQSETCDVVIDAYASPGPPVCVTFPAADSLSGLQSNGIVDGPGDTCVETYNLLGNPPHILEGFAACPVVGTCVFPPQPGSSVPSPTPPSGLTPVQVLVTQGSASVPLNLQVNVNGGPTIPFGACPNGTTGTLTGGPNMFTLSVTNPNASPGGDSYISYVALQNAVNASGILPVWDTTPGGGSSLGTNPLQVTDGITGQLLNPQGAVSGSLRAVVPGNGTTVTLILTPQAASSSLDLGKQFLVKLYFANFLSSCELDVTEGGPSGSIQAPGVLNAFTPITGSVPGGGSAGPGSSGPSGPMGPIGGSGGGSTGANPIGGGGSGGSGPTGSTGAVATVAGVAVTDVNSCTNALGNSGLSTSDASSTCQLVASFVPTGSTFGSFFGCIANYMSQGYDPASAAFSCELAPPTGGGAATSGGSTGSSGPTRTTASGPSGATGNTGASGGTPVPTVRPSTTGPSGGVTGCWRISQSNGYSPVLNLQQSGSSVTGTMTFSASDQAKGNYASNSTSLSGTINGNQLQFTTNPLAKKDGSSSQGQYSGTVSQGQITNGTAVDVQHPGSTATWTASSTGC
jgi:hypothetical protein